MQDGCAIREDVEQQLLELHVRQLVNVDFFVSDLSRQFPVKVSEGQGGLHQGRVRLLLGEASVDFEQELAHVDLPFVV